MLIKFTTDEISTLATTKDGNYQLPIKMLMPQAEIKARAEIVNLPIDCSYKITIEPIPNE